MSAAVASAAREQMDRTTEPTDFLASGDTAFASRQSLRMLSEAMAYADAMFIHRVRAPLLLVPAQLTRTPPSLYRGPVPRTAHTLTLDAHVHRNNVACYVILYR